MATLGLSKVFILDKYFTELQKFWETEKKLQDASSSNEAVHLQRRLLSLSSELVTLRNHLHVGGAGAGADGAGGEGEGAPAAAPATLPKCPAPHPAVPPRVPPPAPTPTASLSATEGRWQRSGGGGVGGAVGGGGAAGAAAGGADVDDLIHLHGPLTEDALVRALQARFYHNKFYTNIGPILVAVNAYTDTHNPLTLSAARGPARAELSRLVQDAVRQQADTGYPQAIVLSGGSGAGKTYASMLLLRRLFDVAGGGPETDAFKHLAAAFTVLRSLGTAATPANSHSSRIGHFIEVQVTDGALYRTKIHCYFLDQTRVIKPLPGERNYHIFYQMLAGLSAEERARLHLEGYSAHELRYLQPPDQTHHPHQPRQPDPEDAARFQAWKSCLGILGIPFLDVVRVLAAVLLLGNVQFAEDTEGAAEAEGAEVAAAAALLGVSAAALVRGLTRRSCPRGARSPATAAAAAAARDRLAKALYCRTVATIVRRANSLKRLGSTLGTLSSDSNESVHNQDAASRKASTAGGGSGGGRTRAGAESMAALNDAVRSATDGFVGILDMFGFEEASPARLEHLCVNLCAETMQHFYNTHVFKSAAESCREEGVRGAPEPEYADNVPCIDLVSSLRGGLLAALDAACAARADPATYVARVRAAHRHSPRLLEARPPHASRFRVRHFAADVQYDATEFLDANRDSVPDDAVAVFDRRGCDFGFATHLFGVELKALSAAGGPRGSHFRASPTSHQQQQPATTLTQDFHTRLDNLLRTLVHARPHFVRCIRANATEAPMVFERTTVAKQVRALQALETATLMASGYPHRMRFRAFSARYRLLCAGAAAGAVAGAEAEACGEILRALEAAPPASPPAASPAAVRWAVGKRHVFLSEGMRQVLERTRRRRRDTAALAIQAAWRRHRARAAALPAPHTPHALAAPTRPPAPPARRPRPAPIAGTPPPDPADKCEPNLVTNACTLFGLDLERPPPLPPSRAYTVAGGVKLSYPMSRSVAAAWREAGAGASAGGAQLRPGDTVLVLGTARRGHLAVRVAGRTVHVPHRVLRPPLPPQPPPPPPPLTTQ